MASCLALCALLALAGFTQAKLDRLNEENIFKKCQEETGAEETYDIVITQQKVPTSDKGMCLMECLLRAHEIYDAEGKFNPEGSKKWIDKRFETDEEKLAAMEIVKECSKIDVTGLDKCEAAVKHVTCAKIKGLKRNLSAVKK